MFTQMVILSLIVKRARVKALVKDKQAVVEAFGTYVEVNSQLFDEQNRFKAGHFSVIL